MQLSRRQALQLGAGAALVTGLSAVGCAPQRAPVEQSTSPKRVLVLGAGMSGLTAALALHRRGHDVEVLETQDRVGGRLISITFANGQTTEGGGGHFRLNMPLTAGYISKFKLPIIAMNDGCPAYLIDGLHGDATRLDQWPWNLHTDERNVELSTRLTSYFVPLGADFSTVLEPEWPSPADADKFDGITVRDLLVKEGASDAFSKLVAAQAGGFMLDVSVLGLLPDFAYHFGDRNLFRVLGGNDKLPQRMSTELPEGKIHLGAGVRSIGQNEHEATVVTADGRKFTGDAVVSTIPFSVLKDVTITPGLPPKMKDVVDGMLWASIVKVYLENGRASWIDRGVRGWPVAASDRPWERLIDITGNEPGGRGNAFFYLSGENAKDYLTRPPATRANDLVNQFNADTSNMLDDVVEIGEYSWPDQPWIKGAFGDTPTDGGWMLEEMKKPFDRIHWAGDFTTFKSGWVEGAIESGLRAARQIDPQAPAEHQIA